MYTFQSSLKRCNLVTICLSFILLMSSCNSVERQLFVHNSLQDSLDLFIHKNKASIENPYGAPTICIVTIEETEKETIVCFMANIVLIEDVIIDGVDRPLLEIQGACMQDDMIVVLYASQKYRDLINYNCLELHRRDYDYFDSYDGKKSGFELYPFSYRRYRLTKENQLELLYRIRGKYEK